MSSNKNRSRKPAAVPPPVGAAHSSFPGIATAAMVVCAFVAPILSGVPDERVWSSIVCAVALAAVGRILFKGPWFSQPTATADRMVLFGAGGLAAAPVLSLLWRWLVIDHAGPEYIDPMLRGLAYWSSLAGLTVVAAATSGRSRSSAYVILVAIVATAGLASGMGLQDYLISVFRRHIAGWREFGTSTPDYFAAYLLITIPISLGLFLVAPAGQGKRIGLLYGLAFLLQLAVLPTTGSRFALISLAVAILVFAICVLAAVRNGFRISASFRTRLVVLVGIALLGAVVVVKPIVHRLGASTLRGQANSGEFRVYTWRGSVTLASHSLPFGSGPGTFVYAYPKYAIVGFTRAAHSGYLQLLDELGPLGLAAALSILFGGIWCGIGTLRRPKSASADRLAPPTTGSSFLENVAPEIRDEPIVIAGLIAGVAAALVQNLIDSDSNMILFGLTLFLAAGLLAGLHAQNDAQADQEIGRDAAASRAPLRIGLAALAALFAIQCVVWTGAYAAASAGNNIQATRLVPLSGEFYGALGWQEFKAAMADPHSPGALDWLSAAQTDLTKSVQLAPDSLTYYRLANVLEAERLTAQALQAIQTGLSYDPHSVELLLFAAQTVDNMGNHSAALAYYSELANLQQSPYGTVLAISDSVPYRYAFADYAIGVDDRQRHDETGAIAMLGRARGVLLAYLGEDPNMRLATGEGSDVITQLQTLYSQVMDQLSQAYAATGQPRKAAAAEAEQTATVARFASLAAQQTTAPTAAPAPGS